MKILFVICEGPHDAQFVSRLLQESQNYQIYGKQIRDFPQPLNKFFSGKFENRSIQDIRIGKPDFPLIPICALKNIDSENLVLPIAIGGMDKFHEAINLLNEFSEYFAYDTLDVTASLIKGYSVLFLFDADSRGKDDTVDKFKIRFGPYSAEITPEVLEKWIPINNHGLSLFIFTGDDGVTGTLEDLILELFRKSSHAHVGDTESHFGIYFEACAAEGDPVTHASKQKKGVLTACGQMEKRNAGSALSVIIRDTVLLQNAFDFSDSTNQWSRLLLLINKSFE